VVVTLGEVVRELKRRLAVAGVPEPGPEAEWIAAHVLTLPRTMLIVRAGQGVERPLVDAMFGFVARRARREPLQHILGSVPFCSIEVDVGPAALVPRPETEMLAEAAWTWANGRGGTVDVLDFGTGTGCIALAIARECPTARVHALDRSAEALALAIRNACELELADRVAFYEGDGFGALSGGARFDLIVSNPPYIAADEIGTLMPEVRDYDPRLALDGGADGLDFYRRLAAEAPDWLRPGGCLMCEFGDGQEQVLPALFVDGPWKELKFQKDLSETPRFFKVTRV
jgi:release factor glutamine methyltransferase